MSRVEEIKELMEEKKDMVLDNIEDIHAEILNRKKVLEDELEVIKDTLGDHFENAQEEVQGFVDKIKANIKPLLIGAGLFFLGALMGALSVYYG